jgi:hypothetical protein
MRVPDGHPEIRVPEDLLDLLERGAVHDEIARRRVPEIMESEVGNPCPPEGRVPGRPDLTAAPAGAEHPSHAQARLGLERDSRRPSFNPRSTRTSTERVS